MNALGDDLWHVPGPDFPLPLGAKMPVGSTVIRLPDRALVVYSPVAFDDAAAAAIAAQGEVAHVIAPNLLHHRFAGDAIARWPGATLHAPSGLAAKRADLPVARAHAEAAFGDALEVIPIGGATKVDEVALFHHPTGTLICADLVFHITRPANVMSRLVFATTGVGGGRLAQSRAWKMFTKDREALRASVDRILALPVRQLAPVHGEPLAVDAATLARVMARGYGGTPRAAAAAT